MSSSVMPIVLNHLKSLRPAVQAKFFWATGSLMPGAWPIRNKPPCWGGPVPETGQLPPWLKHLEHPRMVLCRPVSSAPSARLLGGFAVRTVGGLRLAGSIGGRFLSLVVGL